MKPSGTRNTPLAPCLTLFLPALLVLLAALEGCGGPADPGQEDPGPRPQAIRPRAERPGQLEEKARETVREDGPYRFFDRERRHTAQHVAWLLLKQTRLPSVSLQKTMVELVGSLKGVSLGHLEKFYQSLGLKPVVVAESLEAFLRHNQPGVLALRSANPHLPETACTLILYRGLAPDGRLQLTDPLTGIQTVTKEHVKKIFLEAALYLEPAAAGPPPESPDIAADEILFNYDRVDSGTLVRKTFRLFNRGGQELKIFGVRTSCGCAAAPVHEKGARVADPRARFKRNPDTGVWEIDFDRAKNSTVVPPGGEVYVTGFYDTTNRIGRQPTSFTVLSNDPDEREVTFFIEGFVTQVAQFDPPVLYWRKTIPSAAGIEANVWVRSMSGKTFQIERIHTANAAVEVVEDPDASREPPPPTALPDGFTPRAHPESEGWKAVKVKIKPGAPVGSFNAVVTLYTGLSPSPLAFGVWGKITGNIVVDPTVAHFGQVPLGRQAEARVRVHSEVGPNFQITSAQVDRPELMDLEMTEEKPGNYLLVLRLKKGWQAPSIDGRIGLKTNDLLEPIKYISLVGFVQRPGAPARPVPR